MAKYVNPWEEPIDVHGRSVTIAPEVESISHNGLEFTVTFRDQYVVTVDEMIDRGYLIEVGADEDSDLAGGHLPDAG